MSSNNFNEKIMILGHTGFIGSSILNKFQQSDDGPEVLGISSATVDLTHWDEVKALEDKFDQQTVLIMCAGVKPHVAASLESFHTNMAMAYNLARLLRDHPARRLIFFSSIIVYGEMWDDLDIDEDTPVNPDTYYGIAKVASEGLFKKVVDESEGMSLVVFRPSLVYGPTDLEKPYGPSAFARAINSQGHITLWGDGSELRDFIFLDDVANMTQRAAFADFTGTFNLVSGESHSFKDIVDAFEPLYEPGFEVRTRERTRPKVDQGFNIDNLLAAVPDFYPTKFEEGMRQTFLQAVSANRDLQPSIANDRGGSV